MAAKFIKSGQKILEAEVGTIRKSRRGRVRVALVYPNSYHVGMSSLGFQTLYQQFNRTEHVVCERFFLPDVSGVPVSVESGSPLADADLIAFSISFENDYPNLLAILDQAGIPPRSKDRGSRYPLVIAGGVACILNPEPLAAFIDCFLLGEAESILSGFLEIFAPGDDKNKLLKRIARNVAGAYVPAFFQPRYHADGTLASFEPLEDVPAAIKRAYLPQIDAVSTCSSVVTPNTSFGRSFLVEVSRGCLHGCRFCSAGFIYRPPRFRSTARLEQAIARGVRISDRIGLVGAAVSDLPDIENLCARFNDGKTRISFSSLRADRLTPELLSALKQSRVKTATIAPEVGSERMRKVINKGISENDILGAASALVENGIPNLKLYFMVGLPTETEADVEAIVTLCKKIKHCFLTSSRTRGRIGRITVSLNCFVPKPATPFQWAAMDEISILKQKIKKIKTGLKKVPNVRVNADIVRWAHIQAIFSRGDRKVADILSRAHANRGNWAQTLKTVPTNPNFYALRQRKADEKFPWDFIDHGVRKSFLWQEYQRALNGLTTPACRVETCRACGICNNTNQ